MHLAVLASLGIHDISDAWVVEPLRRTGVGLRVSERERQILRQHFWTERAKRAEQERLVRQLEDVLRQLHAVQAAIQPTSGNITCPICLHPIQEEVVTRCGHFSCNLCLKEWLRERRTKEDGTLEMGRCPTCRKEIRQEDTLRVYLP